MSHGARIHWQSSASAIFLAIYLGLTNTLIIGGICYLVAAALARPRATA